MKGMLNKILSVTLLMTPLAHAEDMPIQGILAVAKMTGACGIMSQMIQLQESTQMPSSDKFVERFIRVESARQGITPEKLASNCKLANEAYSKFSALAGEVDKQK